MTTIVYGYEVKKDIESDSIIDYTDNSDITKEINVVYDYLTTAIESFNTLISIKNHTENRSSLEDISENERKILQVTLDSVTTRLGLESVEYKPDTFTKVIDQVYLAIVSLIDIAFELIVRFYKWFKEQFELNSKKSAKITSAIRYILNNTTKDTFVLRVPGKEAGYFTNENGLFDIGESISLYSTLFSLYSKNTNTIANVNNALKYKFQDKEFINVKFDPIFPVLEKVKYKDNLYKHLGPYLPNGYRLIAIMPDDQSYSKIPEDQIVQNLDPSPVMMHKENSKEGYMEIQNNYYRLIYIHVIVLNLPLQLEQKMCLNFQLLKILHLFLNIYLVFQ